MSDTGRFDTRCVHAGERPDPTTGAISTPIYYTSTYVQPSPGVFKDGYDYSRSANPTRTALESKLASLEGGEVGLAFSSGVATIDCVLHLLKSGDHVVLSDDVYGGTFRVFKRVFEQLGIAATRVDMTDHAQIESAFNANTRLVWFETPTNPTLKVIDIKKVSQIAHARNAMVVVDNTFASPALQQPIALGADIVSHSLTKYLGGHADIVGGALIARTKELGEQLRFVQNAVGAVPSPMDCFLVLRSIKTLHLRMQRHCESAMTIARHLEKHPAVDKVVYPGLESHPQHAIAKEQMCMPGGMITIYVAGGLEGAKKMLERVRYFSLAESLGGVESLIEHPAIMTHSSIPAEERAKIGIDDSLVRLSVGIEDVDDLIADLDQALA